MMTFYDILQEVGSDGKIITPGGEYSEKMMLVPYTAHETHEDIEMSELGFTDDERFLLIMGGNVPQFDKVFSHIELNGTEYEILSSRRFSVEGGAEHVECIIRERQGIGDE